MLMMTTSDCTPALLCLQAGEGNLSPSRRTFLERMTQVASTGVVLIGTIRKDGSPRISCVEPCILDGVLYLGMMWQSRKALDLLQDPRIVVHNTICTSTGDEVEFSLHGRAIDIRDPEVRRRYVSER